MVLILFFSRVPASVICENDALMKIEQNRIFGNHERGYQTLGASFRADTCVKKWQTGSVSTDIGDTKDPLSRVKAYVRVLRHIVHWLASCIVCNDTASGNVDVNGRLSWTTRRPSLESVEGRWTAVITVKL